MDPQPDQNNYALIERYLDQPAVMPKEIRAHLEAAWNDQPVQLYALADLNESFILTRTWVALGPEHVAILGEGSGAKDFHLSTFPRSRVREIREQSGLSNTVVTLMDNDSDHALAVIRYTHRQRDAMGPILFLLKQQGATRALTREEGDDLYASSMAKGIKKAQSSVTGNRLDVFWRLAAFLKPYWKRFTVGVVSALFLTALSLTPPYLTGYLLDDVLLAFADGQLSIEKAYRLGWIVLAVIVVVYILREILLWLRLRMMTLVGEKVARDLRTAVYDHLHKLSVNYFSHHHTGSIVSRVSSDTDRIWDFIAFGLAELTLSLLMVLGIGGVLIVLDWQLGLAVTLPVPVIFFGIYRMGQGLRRRFLRMWHKWSEMTAVISDTIPGIRVVKAFNQEDFERERFGKRNRGITEEAYGVINLWTTAWPIIYFGLSLMMVIVWALALPRLLGDGSAESVSLTPGLFVTFLLYLGLFIAPIESFGFLTRMINRSLSSAHRIFEVLDTEPEVVEAADSITLDPVNGRIEFEEVSFGYDPVRQIVSDITFDVAPGEMIGLVGPSGAGKTTIINLIARFYDVNSGRILIDGVDLQDLDLGSYRQQIGMVMQDPYLFNGSVLDNIRYGIQEVEIEKVIDAARAANAHDFICRMPQGYDTVVGERGHTLSGGERQRVSIARAVLHDPRILILDEATSSVDTETERKIQEALERLVEGRTVIAIAHRLSTLRKADRLFVMKEGKLVEQGQHSELLANADGVYRRLHDLQQELQEMYAV